jgi:peptidoglycan/LPS O-acetylase OafA/YrhL
VSSLAATRREDAPSPAVAPPPGNPRFPLFDSLRALAILTVLVYHVAAVTGELNRPVIGDLIAVGGAKALDLLFLTSGFLLYRPFVRARAAGRPPPSPRRYLRRRLLRILPAYWFALTVLAIYPGVSGVFSHDWWRFYFFLQLYSSRTLNVGIPVAWTLCVEMTFYLLLPVWARCLRRVRLPGGRGDWLGAEVVTLAAVMLGGAAVQVAASRLRVSQIVADSLLGNCTWIALGMLLAALSVWAIEQRRPLPGVLALAARPGLCWAGALGCLAASAAILHPGGLLGILLSLERRQPYPRTLADIVLTVGLCALLTLPAVFGDPQRGLVRRFLGWRPLMWVGLVSYGVYLWHLAVVSLLGESADPAHFAVRGLGLAARLHHATTLILLLATVPISLALAALSYYFVELPFLRRKER